MQTSKNRTIQPYFINRRSKKHLHFYDSFFKVEDAEIKICSMYIFFATLSHITFLIVYTAVLEEAGHLKY